MLNVGQRIKERREALEMTQDELAEKTGYKSRSSINKIERGGNDLPQSKIVLFAKVLKTTPSYLLGWEDNTATDTVKEMTALGNKQIMADNIAYYMEVKKIDRNQLCKDLDFKYSTVSEWLSANKYPRIDSIEKMANYFGVTKSALIEKRKSQLQPVISKNAEVQDPSNLGQILPSDNIYKIPLYENVSAGFGAYASNEVIDYIPVVITNPYDVEDTIAIKVKGDSMYPKIENGDIIIVRKQDSVDSGDIAVLLLDGEEGLVKKVVYGDTWIELHSINPEYQVRRFDREEVLRLRVVGKVVGSYKRF